MRRGLRIGVVARPGGASASVLVAVIALLAGLGPAWVPVDPIAQDIMARYLPPAWEADSDTR
ncbi:MAG: hypothetical protein FJX57_14940, partial [Alphaproteobacteria bacterium]|nr:hypothetical protein [Alphaproteobacteria bacterium]